ncbi:PASTA domain-containing protein, partial [Turicibacter sanguinis]|nr:PASTA domain-containing protein [Turicibacter sanguinis]
YTLDYNYINSLISQYKSITPNCTKLSSCKELEVPEDQLYMMKFQLDTIGGTVYDVYAKDMDGNEVHLGTTSDNSFTKDLGYGEMSYYTDFYIRARYENYGALASNNSNSITVDCENCFKPVSIPDMAGWTKAQAESWGSSNGINISFSDEPSTTVAEGIIISNSPNSGTLTPGSTVYVKVATSQLVVPNYQSDSDFINKYQAWGTLNSISIKVNQENHETIASGGFIGSNPGIGSAITPGSTLTITVSKGPASTTPETPETPVIPDPINPDPGVNGDGDDDERATPVGAQTISFIRTLFNFFN